MARLPRYGIPGQPQHVVVRGNNRVSIFVREADYLVFRECLLAASTRYGCAVHAYVLMTNHVHLLTSPKDAHGIGRMLQSVGRRYVRYFNDRNRRSGTLWEGRYRATVIDTERYLFACYRYIERNPVRAGMVIHPSLYPWSSYPGNASGVEDLLITAHERYLALGTSPASRQTAYRAMLAEPGNATVDAEIRFCTHHAWALGSERFQFEMGRAGRRAAPRAAGRPRLREIGV